MRHFLPERLRRLLPSLWDLCDFRVSVVPGSSENATADRLSTMRSHREALRVVVIFALLAPLFLIAAGRQRGPSLRTLGAVTFQDPNLDYSKFLHSSQRHASLACTNCHDRSSDNSITPRFPGHKACTSCHLGQFTTPAIPMCSICHANTSSGNPPLKDFPVDFNESFNVKFDHAQHLTAAARPKNGCAGCHASPVNRGLALSIPANISAHTICYSCHTQNSKTPAGREMASCGVCHDQRKYARTSTNARAFRFSFSHAKHGPRERLACTDCHQVTRGAAQSRQVSSPAATEHFPTGRGMNCITCHNGRRSFGGDLAFKDCRRCHTAASFRMPN